MYIETAGAEEEADASDLEAVNNGVFQAASTMEVISESVCFSTLAVNVLVASPQF